MAKDLIKKLAAPGKRVRTTVTARGSNAKIDTIKAAVDSPALPRPLDPRTYGGKGDVPLHTVTYRCIVKAGSLSTTELTMMVAGKLDALTPRANEAQIVVVAKEKLVKLAEYQQSALDITLPVMSKHALWRWFADGNEAAPGAGYPVGTLLYFSEVK